MNRIKLFFGLGIAVCLTACVSGPGTSIGSTGSARLSLQLAELSPGADYQTLDGFRLTFSTFAMAFDAITLGSATTDESFFAEFADEEITDVVELEDIVPGNYDEVTMTLGTASGLTGLVISANGLKAAASGDEVASELSGHSVLMVAEATSGNASCTLNVTLDSSATVTVAPAGNEVTITAGEEAELLIEVDPDKIFGTVSLGALCSGGTTVSVATGAANSTLATTLLDHLVHNEALALGDSSGHAHGH